MNFNSKKLVPELTYKTSRSGGAGGQNVNKVESKVLLAFDVLNSNILNEEQKVILLLKLGKKITSTGILQIVAQTERNQLGNKQIALAKFHKLISTCFAIKKKRNATKPSKASKEDRLKAKKHKSEIKTLRGKLL